MGGGPGHEVVGEAVEIVDDHGTVLGVMSRANMRAHNLRHRSVVIAVLWEGAVLAHQRADWKDLCPGWWDLAFGGCVRVGEPWLDAAVRELGEESGVVVAPGDLVPLGRELFDGSRSRLVAERYVVHSAGPFTCPDGEVAALEWVPLSVLPGWLANHLLMEDTAELILPLLQSGQLR
jgi:8-oxo-dGTP pyrophosphatase MutT (NUDIX family)